MPRQFTHDAHRQAIGRIGAHKRVLHKQVAAFCVGHHPFFQGVELVLREIFVYVALENFVRAARLAHDSFVFC